jgi:hypothetical protein
MAEELARNNAMTGMFTEAMGAMKCVTSSLSLTVMVASLISATLLVAMGREIKEKLAMMKTETMAMDAHQLARSSLATAVLPFQKVKGINVSNAQTIASSANQSRIALCL